MKKRIRKKLHVGEFKQTGNVIFINTDGNEQTAENVLKLLEPIIESHSLTIAGGGTGRIIIPPGRFCKQMPLLAGIVVTTVADETFDPDLMMILVYVKGASDVPQQALDAIMETFADEKYELQISKRMELWNSRL
ncbi:MAG: DUF469 family protein [Muribaculaceae bacterium]|nr:DUF469 family protein [Muribaculaceae bacterium]